MKKRFGAVILSLLLLVSLLPANVKAEEVSKLPKENSWRYQNGELIKRTYKGAKQGTQTPDIIDVSYHNGTINWEKVQASGVKGAILRCGYGGNTKSQDDTSFAYNVSECQRLGIPYGIYLYSYATTTAKMKSEVDHIHRLLKGMKTDYPIFLDIEDNSLLGLSVSQHTTLAKVFVKYMKQYGYDNLGFYANYYFFTTRLTGGIFSSYPRWVAQYASKCTYQKNYRIWQYGEQAKVDGINGYVDGNLINGDWDLTSEVTDVTLDQKQATVVKGQSVKLKADVTAKTHINPYVTWGSSNDARASVSASGLVTTKLPGKVTITATTYNGKTAKATITIRPGKNKITSIKKSGKSGVTLKWSKAAGVTGYEVYQSTKKTSGYTKIRTTTKTTYTKTGLKKGKTYYYKVRSYKTWNGKKIYSYDSIIRSIKR